MHDDRCIRVAAKVTEAYLLALLCHDGIPFGENASVLMFAECSPASVNDSSQDRRS